MTRALSLVLVVALSACAGSGLGHSVPVLPQSGLNAMQSVHTATNWSVDVGGATDEYALQDLDYYPNAITIDAGDTITYTVVGGAGSDAHTVSYVPPGEKMPSPDDPKDLNPSGGTTIYPKKFVNSGILIGGEKLTFTFPQPGTYRILCLFHEPAMESTVTVHKAGAPYPHDAAYYRDIGSAQKWQDLAAAELSVSSFPFQPGGTKLAAGIDPQLVHYPPHDSTVLRYVDTKDVGELGTSGNITIKVGTVVTWVNETSNEPHTLTLPKAGGKHLPNIPPDPPVNIAPHGQITKYDGSRIVNSGTFLGGTSFRLMFTKPGTYLYGCLYHANSGMVGTVTVTK